MLIAVAHDIRSMHNVGAIFRTADGAGFERVLLSGCSGGPPDPRLAKVALGAELSIPSERAASIDDLLRLLEGCFVVVLEQHPRSSVVADIALPSEDDVPIALVACGELQGAPVELLDRANAVLELPMRGDKESLNVSVAFGVAAYGLADRVHGARHGLRSREPARAVRPGVLTHGVTTGEVPDRP